MLYYLFSFTVEVISNFGIEKCIELRIPKRHLPVCFKVFLVFVYIEI